MASSSVSRELAVPEDQPSSRVQPRDGRARKHSEGVLVTLLRSRDEVSLVHGRSAVRGAVWSRSDANGAAIPIWVPGERRRGCYHPIRVLRRPPLDA